MLLLEKRESALFCPGLYIMSKQIRVYLRIFEKLILFGILSYKDKTCRSKRELRFKRNINMKSYRKELWFEVRRPAGALLISPLRLRSASKRVVFMKDRFSSVQCISRSLSSLRMMNQGDDCYEVVISRQTHE